MPFIYAQGATSLQKLESDGTNIETLTLPTGLTLSSTRRPRFSVLGKYVTLSNSPSWNILIDPSDDHAVYSLSPAPPPTAATVAAGSTTGLTGAYRARVSFGIKNTKGRLIAESPLGPESSSITLANESLNVTNIPTAQEPGINTRRVYRTLAGGRTYFHWTDLDGNTATSIDRAYSDETIALSPVDLNLGNPPGSFGGGNRLELVSEWKGRLWGRAGGLSIADLDTLLWSEFRRPYAWAPINTLPIPPVGFDSFGITALIPRRDVLGIARRDFLYALTSPNPLSGQLRQISPVGCVSHESVVRVDDTVWFLGEDGIYQWDNLGVTNVSEPKVHPWFTTDDIFERASFTDSVGFYNEARRSLIWLLPATGQATLNRWVEYYPKQGVWLGPHLTSAFTPTYGAEFQDSDSNNLILFGNTTGFLWQEQSTRTDDAGDDATAISLDIEEQPQHAGTPDIEKFWGELSMITNIEASGTLTVTPTVGAINASAGSAISHTLTTGRERLRRLGQGKYMSLRFQNAVAAIDCTINGYECSSVHELGRR